jgi:hypothetical protein
MLHPALRAAFAFAVLSLAACPSTTGTNEPTTSSGKTTKLAPSTIDFAIDLPDDGAGAWSLVEGGGKDDGAFGRTTAQGVHATSLTRMTSSSSCDAALAAAKQNATTQGKTLNAIDRPQWLPSRYWPIGLEAFDGDPSGATPGTAVWLACLDTKGGPVGALTTVRAVGDVPFTASAASVKSSLDAVADAALAAALAPSPSPTPTPVPLPPG